MENILKENGTDNAVIAIQQYFGNDGQLDEEWFVDNIELILDNTERLAKNAMNSRMRAHGVAYDAMLELFASNGYELSSRQVQAGFKKLGLDYKEILKPVVDYVNEKRKEEKESLNEDKEENIVKSYHSENMGGGTMAIFGQLENGKYFAGNEEGVQLYDIDVWPFYLNDEEADWEKIDAEHNKGSLEGDTKEYYELIKQTNFFDKDELEDLRKQVYGIEEEIKPLEDFIQDLVDNFDNITTGDLQGVVEARCMQTGEDENEILDEIYNRVSKLNEDLKYKPTGLEFNDDELRKSWEEQLEADLEDGETLDDLKKKIPFEKWKQDLKNTNEFESLHEDEEVVTDDELELNLDNEIEPTEIDMEPRDLDIEDVEGEVGVAEDSITTEINDANQEVNTELEENEYTISDLINGVKTLIDSEKESITMCNEFLANFAAKTPKDVYEIIESYINDIKDDKLDEQTKLNNLFDALNTYAKVNEPIEREDEIIDEEPEMEEPIIANDDDEIFNSLAEEGKLVVTNFNTLTEQYANYKGIENTDELKLEIRKLLLNNYKILEDKEYTFVSKKLIENKLLAEEKKAEQAKELEKVKKEAEQNAKETGEDTYVYQSVLDGTMFFATQKPTHTALFNKVLVLGKYKVSMEKGEIYTTWLKESKQEYKYKKSLNEEINKTEDVGMVAGVPDGKEVESPVGGNGIVNESKEEREVIEEIDKDYEKLTIDEFKKRNKEYIDLIYRNTWGDGEIDKDLYDDIVNTMYNDSITGNINTKSDYESLNDKIENANIETVNDKVED